VPAFVAERARALEQNRHYGSDVRQGAAFRTFDEICLTTLLGGSRGGSGRAFVNPDGTKGRLPGDGRQDSMQGARDARAGGDTSLEADNATLIFGLKLATSDLRST